MGSAGIASMAKGIVLVAPPKGTQRVFPKPSAVETKQGSVAAVALLVERLPLLAVPRVATSASSLSFQNCTVQRIPAVIDDTRLSFVRNLVSDAQAPPILPGEGTRTTLGFKPSVLIRRGDVIVLHLQSRGNQYLSSFNTGNHMKLNDYIDGIDIPDVKT